MRIWSRFRTAASAAVLTFLAAFSPPLARAEDCVEHGFDGAAYLVCTVDPAAADLRLFWKRADGQPYRSFAAVAQAVRGEGRELVFAMNAGMYQTDYSPVGLYVEKGETLRPADTKVIEGPPAKIPNFYKRPNGVFFIGEKTAGILPTTAFLAAPPPVRFATQSGPMLVIDGQLHPALIPGSTDKTRRSGVGVCPDGQVRFAISKGGVNFHDFARLFRDDLGCANALFLDGGSGTGLYAPALSSNDISWHGGYGPIVGLVR